MGIVTIRPELSAEEKKLPLAKYYDLPLYTCGPLQQQLIDAGPMDPSKAIRPENFLDLLLPEGYHDTEFGYCMMPDGSGYTAIYTTYPNQCEPKMLAWWFRWLNVHTKGMVPGQGNLKYKIWCPADHFDHGFINGKDKTDGIYTIESLDLGQGEQKTYAVRHPFDLREYGLTPELEAELKAHGCFVDCAWESFHTLQAPHTRLPGSHLCLTLSRKNPLGGMEKLTREWIGYGVKDGEVFFDRETPDWMLCEDFLRKCMVHNVIEAQQLAIFLPEIYAEYHDKPDDAD